MSVEQPPRPRVADLGLSCSPHREDPPVRRRSALVSTGLSAALLVSLAACAPSGTTATGDCLPAGEASNAVAVDGGFGSTPVIAFDAPLSAASTQRTVLVEGEGDAAVNGDTLVFEYSLYNGETGDEIETTGFGGATPATFTVDTESEQFVGISQALACSTPGSRLAIVVPPADGFGEEGVPALSLTGSESLVFIIDVLEIQAAPEPVTPEEWTSDVPEVDLSVTPPVVTLPAAGAPAALSLAVLEQGDGDVVGDDATVLVDYQGTSWQTGEIFDQSFGASPATFPVTGVIQGFAAGLIGQQVGTTLLVSIPAELAYGPDPEAHPLGGQDLLFLVTIIDIVE